jgi:hypothetical protein
VSAFVNPESYTGLDVPCPCPPLANGEPRHDHDTVMLRSRLHYGDLQAVSRAGSILGVWDKESATLKLMEIGIGSWTFVNDKGETVEPSTAMIRLLDPGIGQQIQDELEKRYVAAQEAMTVPNGSSGRSEQSSPAITPVPAPRRVRRAKSRNGQSTTP